MKNGNNFTAIFLVSTAFLMGAIQNAIAKSMHSSCPVILLVCTQYALCLLFYLPLLVKTKCKVLHTKRPILMIYRALAGVAYWWSFFYAVKLLPLVDATLLATLAPIWVPIIMFIFLRQKINTKLYLGIIIGFIGVALILQPDNHIFKAGAIIAIISGIFMASTLVAVKSLMKTEKSSTIVMYYYLIATLFAMPIAFHQWIHLNYKQWFLLILNAALMLLHQQFLNQGFSKGSAEKLSVLTYPGVIYAAILGWMFWGEIPNTLSIFGGILICLGGIHVLTRQTKQPLK